MLIFAVLSLILLCFSFVLVVGPPYLPTLTPQVTLALDMLDLKPGQTLLELGSGDGKVLLAAASRGLNAVGYELNPLLVIWSRLRLWRYRKQVKVKWGNFWQAQWPPADGIYTFLLQKYTAQLDKKIVQYPHKPFKLVNFAFTMEHKQPKRAEKGLYYYEYL